MPDLPAAESLPPDPAPDPDPDPIRRPDPVALLPDPEPAPTPLPRTASTPLPRREPPPRPVPTKRPGRALPAAPRQSHRPRAGGRLLAVIAIAVVASALWLIYETFQPGHGGGSGTVRVSVPAGADAGQIGDLLEEKGVIDSGTFFNLNATLSGRRDNLKPGDYTLLRGMAYGQALDALIAGPKAKIIPTFRLTIPEGLSGREVAPRLKKVDDLDGDYLKATASRAALRKARRLGLPRKGDTLEGFLFPATYELVKGSSMEDLVDKQLDAFAQNMAEVDMRTAKRRNLTRYDVLVIASMVEREAQLAKERPLVAAVIHNRLREGIPLGIDATIRYIENNWTSPLKVSELSRPGPYNTRQNRGLPPTPIGNPGLSSLKAAARPANVDYLFYVVKPGTCGEHAFSSSDREFQRDQARYNAAREAAGGKSPTKC